MAEVVVNKITGEVIEGYSNQDLSLIPAFDSVSQFTPLTDYVEFSIYDEQGNLKYIDPNYTSYQVTLNYNNNNNSVSTVSVNPEQDLEKEGYDQGKYTVYYNFLRNELSSSLNSPFFLSQISSGRDELRISTNNLTNEELEQAVINFTNELNDSPYFEDFRLNFGNNNIFIANNILLDTTNTSQYTVLVKLYEPLPSQIQLKDSVTVALQTADEVSFNVEFEPKVIDVPPPSIKIGAPNFNINLEDKSNNSTNYKSSNDLLSPILSSSYDQIQNLLNKKGITPNVDYTDFNNFVYFSSAEQRVRNFNHKVGLIQEYDREISDLDGLSDSSISSSIGVLETKKRNIIQNFDGYEYYQYYSSGSSDIYPKTNTTPPYTLADTGSALALAWLEDQAVTSGSSYDLENPDRLVNSLPAYVTDDTVNEPFLLFMDMVGQHFDSIWVYTADIANRFDGDNRLDYGISKDAVKDALTSMGLKTYQNNLSDYNIFTALTNVNEDGTTNLPSGSGEINTETVDIADPEPKEDIVKGIYKRLFHNLPFLLKKKGSVEGLRALINTFGVPEFILRISEFAGEKSEENFWKYYQNISNYGMTGGNLNTTLQLHPKWGSGVPDSILFRVKWISGSLPSNDAIFSIADFSDVVSVKYVGASEYSGSYNGSIPSSSWAVYSGELDINNGQDVITAPIFNGEWWTIGILNKNKALLGSNGNHGSDGFRRIWKTTGEAGTTKISGDSGNIYGGNATTNGKFIFQELRYYSGALSNETIDNYIMNPLSMGSGRGQSTDNLAFRAPMGSDLDTTDPDINIFNLTSKHPRVTGSGDPSWITPGGNGSQIYPSFTSTPNSKYRYLLKSPSFVENNEFAYYKEPVVGIKNRVSRKIKDTTQNIVGTTLSNLSSIQQKALNEDKLTPDVDYLEVGFSPQNEINDDIAFTYGNNFDIGAYIGDPSNFTASFDSSYLALHKESERYFEKYSSPYDWNDYARLIKYFDNSLFKLIKDFTPAKSNLATGVIIKQHLLERNKHTPAQVSLTSHSYEANVPQIGNIEGGAGGVFNAVNGLNYYLSESVFNSRGELTGGNKPYPPGAFVPTPFVSQSWQEVIHHKSGSEYITRNTQEEFYNGELGGSTIAVTDGDLNSPDVSETRTDRSFISEFSPAYVNPNFADFVIFARAAFYTDGGNAWNSVTALGFKGTDANGNNRDFFFEEIGAGTPITVKVNNTGAWAGYTDTYTFTATAPASNYQFGGTNNYTISISPVALPNLPLIFTIGILYYNTAEFPDTSFDIVYEDNNAFNTATLLSDSPILNNVSRIRKSSVFMDIDYSSATNGNGILTPVNINQIISGSAVKAPIQDSNYSLTSWTNGRYRGTKVSSVGFNIKSFRN